MANNISLKKGIMLTASFLFLVVLITVITSLIALWSTKALIMITVLLQ